jgi:hypothetical protein
MTNWKCGGRKQLWTSLRSYPGICLEGLNTIMENLTQSLGWDLNPKPPQRTAQVLPARMQHLAQPFRLLRNCWRFPEWSSVWKQNLTPITIFCSRLEMHKHCSAKDCHILILNSLWFLYAPPVSTLKNYNVHTHWIPRIDYSDFIHYLDKLRAQRLKNR